MKASRESRVESREPAAALDPRPSTLDPKFSAVILAGGKSSRMGRDKAWLEIGGRTLLARQIELVRAVGATEVFISGRPKVDYAAFGCQVLQDRFQNAGPLAGIESALATMTTPLLLVLAVDMPEMNAGFLKKLRAVCAERRPYSRAVSSVSLSSPKGGEGRGEEAPYSQTQIPSPQPSPRLGGERETKAVVPSMVNYCGVIPQVHGRIEPLAAFYPKASLDLAVEMLSRQRAGSETGAPGPTDFARECVKGKRATLVEVTAAETRYFTNLNSPEDLRAT